MRSASQPPTGRTSAASTGPMNANLNASTAGNSVLTSIGKPAARPMNEPKVPVYSQLIRHCCLCRTIATCSAKPARTVAMLSMPNHAAITDMTISGTQMKPAFCTQICIVVPWSTRVCALPPRISSAPPYMAIGAMSCARPTPRLPTPALRPSAVPCSRFG